MFCIRYLLPYPNRLSTDGTFSRMGGCCVASGNQPDYLWADDQYMGLTLISRLVCFIHFLRAHHD